jgi:glycosyltransferase 2 family protein
LKTSVKKVLRFLGFLSIGVLLLYFAFRDINPVNLFNEIKNANYFWIVLSLIFSVISLFSRAYRWNMIIEPLGFKPLYWNTFFAMMTGYLTNFAFPRLGEITRCATLSKKEKIPADKLLGTVIVERVVDLASLAFLLVLLLVLKFETFGNFLYDSVYLNLREKMVDVLGFSWIIWIIILVFITTVILLYFLVFRETLSTFKAFMKFKNIVKGVIDGLKTVYKMKRRMVFIFHSVFIWLMYLLMTWVVVFAIPATSSLGIIDGLFILVIGGLGMSAPVQSGIGAFHWIVSRGIVSVYPYISMEQALAFATISHGFQSLTMIVLGSVSLFLLVYFKKSANMEADLISGTVEFKRKVI